MLYLIATPIGNLSDITFRAIKTLETCHYILCEDTRHSLTLLRHYQIEKPLVSYHKFNETSRLEQIADDLRNGKEICLISDAGTPGISDPGEILIRKCVDENLPFTAIPGPCAVVQALSCSGFPLQRFQFFGFLPKKEGELKRELQGIFAYPGTTACYESPHRLIETLEMIRQIQPECDLVIARELTKKFEEIVRGKASFLIEYWNSKVLKGEIVLLISPSPANRIEDWSVLTPEEHVDRVSHDYSISRKEAIKLVAELRGVPKREVYSQLIKTRDQTENA